MASLLPLMTDFGFKVREVRPLIFAVHPSHALTIGRFPQLDLGPPRLRRAAYSKYSPAAALRSRSSGGVKRGP
jgi:hypothetical protein